MIKYKYFTLILMIFAVSAVSISFIGTNLDENPIDIKPDIDENPIDTKPGLDDYSLKAEKKIPVNPIEKRDKGIKTASNLTPKEAYAIVIGVADYPGSVNDLSYTDDDAQEVYSMLINDYNFKPENVIYLQDSNAAKNAIDNAFDLIASQINQDDIFFFYYSGHGGANTINNGTYSYTINSPHPYSNNYGYYWSIFHPNAVYMRVHFDHFDLEYDYDYVFLGDSDLVGGWYYEGYTGYSTGFWSGWIPLLSDNKIYIKMETDSSVTKWGFRIDSYEIETYDGTHFLAPYDSVPSDPTNYYLDTILDSKLDLIDSSEKYILLDACNTGGMIPEVQDIGRYIMTACASEELSYEDDALQNGIFTYYFLRSLDYATDSNGDGVISFEESFSYTYSNTVSYSNSSGVIYFPQESDGIAGESVIQTEFGNFSLSPHGNMLDYSFNLHGTGLINLLKIGIYNISQSVSYAFEDLTINSPSNTGFGQYSGTIELDGVTGLTGFGIFVEVQGNRIIFLNNTVSGDSDSDALEDILELMIGSDPLLDDTDGDGIMDGEELLIYSTNPLDPDSDNDGLTDGEEILIYHTDPLNKDTDGDGYSDGVEVSWGTDPLDPKISLNTYFFNIAGAVVLISSSYYVVRTQVIKRRRNRQKDKTKLKEFKIDQKIKTYNALTVYKQLKPKPIRPVYQPRSKIPIYYKPSTPSNYSDTNTMKDLILNRLPLPKSSESLEGKRALMIANTAFVFINQGRYKESFEYIINALILGVPEPMNSTIKKILLDSLNRGYRSPTSRYGSSSSYNDPLEYKKCMWCSKVNHKSSKFCVNCGKVL